MLDALCSIKQLSTMQEYWCTITKLSESDPKWSLQMEIITLRPDNLHHGTVNVVLEISNFLKLFKTLQDKLKFQLESSLFNLMILQWHIKFVRKVGFQITPWLMLHLMVHKFLSILQLLTVNVESWKEKYKWSRNLLTDMEELTVMSTREVLLEIVHILMDVACFLKMERLSTCLKFMTSKRLVSFQFWSILMPSELLEFPINHSKNNHMNKHFFQESKLILMLPTVKMTTWHNLLNMSKNSTN